MHLNRVRNFSARDLLPLVKTVDRDQAAPFLERASVRRRCIDGLDSGIYRLVGNFLILRPGWDQSPAKGVDLNCKKPRLSLKVLMFWKTTRLISLTLSYRGRTRRSLLPLQGLFRPTSSFEKTTLAAYPPGAIGA